MYQTVDNQINESLNIDQTNSKVNNEIPSKKLVNSILLVCIMIVLICITGYSVRYINHNKLTNLSSFIDANTFEDTTTSDAITNPFHVLDTSKSIHPRSSINQDNSNNNLEDILDEFNDIKLKKLHPSNEPTNLPTSLPTKKIHPSPEPTYAPSIENYGVVYSDETCDCTTQVRNVECSVSGNPVLAGVDFVEYFKGNAGVKGVQKYHAVYEGNLYYFKSRDNHLEFLQKPTKYIPQFGGYCSWGMTAEYCPSYPWNSDCLGPPVSWSLWTIYNDKLYFFYKSDAKDKFLSNPDLFIEYGNKRFSKWFTGHSDIPYNTNCAV